MSVATAITSARNKIAAAFAKVAERGGTLPTTQNLANLPTAIESIPSGGGVSFDAFYQSQHDAMEILKSKIDSTYVSGCCFAVKAGIDVTLPTADKIVLANGETADSGATIGLPVDTENAFCTTYFVCLYTTEKPSVTTLYNDANLRNVAFYNVNIPLLSYNGTSSQLCGFQAEKCTIKYARKTFQNTNTLFYKDVECTATYNEDWINVFQSITAFYIYSEAIGEGVSSYMKQAVSGSKIAYAEFPNANGAIWSAEGGNCVISTSNTIQVLNVENLNRVPDVRQGSTIVIKTGKVTEAMGAWALNTANDLEYLEIGQDSEVDIRLGNSKLFTAYTSNLAGAYLVNANVVKGLASKVKDFSGTTTTRTITFPSAVFALLTDETKAIFTNKNWNVASA